MAPRRRQRRRARFQPGSARSPTAAAAVPRRRGDDALPVQDQEVLLHRLGVIPAVRLSGLHDLDVHAGVRPWRVVGLEVDEGRVDLLVANAGVSEGHAQRPSWEIDVDEWWQVYEVNVLGVHLCCRAVIPGMLERGRGRIVITGSGAAYLPHARSTAYAPSKAALCRYGETLANELTGRIPVFFFSPGLVRTEMTGGMGLL